MNMVFQSKIMIIKKNPPSGQRSTFKVCMFYSAVEVFYAFGHILRYPQLLDIWNQSTSFCLITQSSIKYGEQHRNLVL